MRRLFVVLTIILTLLCSSGSVYAARDPNVFLVNPVPNSVVNTNNLLISVKLTEPKKIQVTVLEYMQIVNGTRAAVNANSLTTTNGSINTANYSEVVIDAALPFSSKNNLSFYTKQITVPGPGLYRIQIETLDEANKVTATNNSLVIVKEKATEETKVFDTPQSGTMQFLQNLLKNIFGE